MFAGAFNCVAPFALCRSLPAQKPVYFADRGSWLPRDFAGPQRRPRRLGGGQEQLSGIRAPCFKHLEIGAGGGKGFGCVGTFEAQQIAQSIAKSDFGV